MFRKLFVLALALTCLPGVSQIAKSGIMSPVLTRGYNNARTGTQLNETVFTQANVAAQGIRKYFSLPMEGDKVGAEAQTLIVPSVPVDDGTTRDLAVIAAMNNLVYAFDANDSDIIWVKKLAVPINGSKLIDGWMVNDHWGVLSTPVIDPDTNLMYVVAWTDPNGNPTTARWYLHTISLKDGSRPVPPVLITGVSDGQNFNSMMRKQRSSLALATYNGRKTVFFACGTVSESGAGAAGYIFAYDVQTNTISASLAMSAGRGAGIWMAGSGVVVDENGFLYATTGNGSFNGTTDFGESTVKVQYTPPQNGQAASLAVVDHWTAYTDTARMGMAAMNESLAKAAATTPATPQAQVKTFEDSAKQHPLKLAGENAQTLDEATPVNVMASSYAGWYDEDYGSAGISYWQPSHCLVTAGKDGIEYSVNTLNLGQTTLADIASGQNYNQLLAPPIWLTYFPGYQFSPDPATATGLDFLPGGKTRHQHSTPVLYNSSVNGVEVFTWGENSPLRVFKVNPNCSMTYLAQSNEIASANVVNPPGGMPGGFMTLSANGSTTGTAIIWACIPYNNANTAVTNGRLLAYDAEHFGPGGVLTVLWDSQAAGIPFLYNKFNPPVVSGGKLFVPTYADTTDVYGLN